MQQVLLPAWVFRCDQVHLQHRFRARICQIVVLVVRSSICCHNVPLPCTMAMDILASSKSDLPEVHRNWSNRAKILAETVNGSS